MKIEEYFPAIEGAIEAIESLEFEYSKPFTNSLLKLADIVMLIRDAEPHESRLFTLEKGKKEPQKRVYGSLFYSFYWFVLKDCQTAAGNAGNAAKKQGTTVSGNIVGCRTETPRYIVCICSCRAYL